MTGKTHLRRLDGPSSLALPAGAGLHNRALTNGDNRCCELWAAFAKRGLGYGGKQKDYESKVDGVQDFKTHPTCR
jgi:hypothetical protein